MKVLQLLRISGGNWRVVSQKGEITRADLVICFGERRVIAVPENFEKFHNEYPDAQIVFCSTSGEIADIDVYDNAISAIVIQFEKTEVKAIRQNQLDFENSEDLGKSLIQDLDRGDLSHVFVLSDGQVVNGSKLVTGMNSVRRERTTITGGLAGDGIDFKKTLVGLNDMPKEGEVVAIGFYGENLKIGYGSMGGWDEFGKKRNVTKSEKNVLHELNGESALKLYKEYLGEAADELPGAALYYPLGIQRIDDETGESFVVRTILSIDEEAQTMTFAGDIPEGYTAQLMKRNTKRLINGAEIAAKNALKTLGTEEAPDLAILVSCVGRKVVLGQNIEEEVEAVRELMGEETAITGFYSYGEIAPKPQFSNCDLHNQTMTITTFKEE